MKDFILEKITALWNLLIPEFISGLSKRSKNILAVILLIVMLFMGIVKVFDTNKKHSDSSTNTESVFFIGSDANKTFIYFKSTNIK